MVGSYGYGYVQATPPTYR